MAKGVCLLSVPWSLPRTHRRSLTLAHATPVSTAPLCKTARRNRSRRHTALQKDTPAFPMFACVCPEHVLGKSSRFGEENGASIANTAKCFRTGEACNPLIETIRSDDLRNVMLRPCTEQQTVLVVLSFHMRTRRFVKTGSGKMQGELR